MIAAPLVIDLCIAPGSRRKLDAWSPAQARADLGICPRHDAREGDAVARVGMPIRRRASTTQESQLARGCRRVETPTSTRHRTHARGLMTTKTRLERRRTRCDTLLPRG